MKWLIKFTISLQKAHDFAYRITSRELCVANKA